MNHKLKPHRKTYSFRLTEGLIEMVRSDGVDMPTFFEECLNEYIRNKLSGRLPLGLSKK
jgi:hypothetical protein